MRLSIIVPIYNVEEYISPCLESIFRQGLEACDFEVIAVNDGTPDRSMDVVADCMKAHHNIIIVEQPNQGLSAARNTGMDHASGDYILFLDSDDMLLDGTLPTLLEAAESNHADMAVGDFVKMDGEQMRSARPMPPAVCPSTPTTGKDFFFGEFNPQQCYVWRSLYKRSFLRRHALRFMPGIYFEDVPFTTECYLRAGQCVRVKQTFYVYRQRPGSIVASVSMKKLTDFNTVLARLAQLKSSLCTDERLRRRMDDTIFTTFSIAVWYLAHDKELLAHRHTFVSDLRHKVGHLHCANGMKQRLVSLLFRVMPETYIYLRSL